MARLVHHLQAVKRFPGLYSASADPLCGKASVRLCDAKIVAFI